MTHVRPLALLALSLVACSGSTTPATGGSGGAAATLTDAGTQELRGQRYCEVLLATASATTVHVAVYNTIGLNDCPEAAWSALDGAKLAAETGATKVVLNGPRTWTIDRFVVGAVLDPTVRSFGGIEMREAGAIDVPIAEATSLGASPYTETHVHRNTTVEFDAGKPVRELVAPDGAVYEMQSFSMQKAPLVEADLDGLAARLAPPAGWSYRTRVIEAPLQVTAVDGVATVVQDDLGDTYQRAQP